MKRNLIKIQEEIQAFTLESSIKYWNVASIIEKEKPLSTGGDENLSTHCSYLARLLQFQKIKSLVSSRSRSQDEEEPKFVNIHTKNSALKRKPGLSKRELVKVRDNFIFQ